MFKKCVQRVYAGCVIAAVWTFITCTIVGGYTIYSRADEFLNPHKVERVEVPIILPQGWNEPTQTPKKLR